MLKIVKDNTEMKVSEGAFENLYKGLGFEIVGDNKKATEKPVASTPIMEPTPEIKEEKEDIKNSTEIKDNKQTFKKKVSK